MNAHDAPWPHTADCECDPTAGEPTAALDRLIRADLQAMYGEEER